MNGNAIIIGLNLGRKAIAMLTRISWEDGMNGKAIINQINIGRSAIEMFN